MSNTNDLTNLKISPTTVITKEDVKNKDNEKIKDDEKNKDNKKNKDNENDEKEEKLLIFHYLSGFTSFISIILLAYLIKSELGQSQGKSKLYILISLFMISLLTWLYIIHLVMK
jgi:hypothetical protein